MKTKLTNQVASTKAISLSDGEGGLQIGQLIGAIRRNIFLIIGVTITVGVLAQLKAVTQEPVYIGGFEILTKAVTVENEVISTLPGTLANRQQETIGTVDETKIRVLRSASLLNPLVEQLRSRYPNVTYGTIVNNLDIRLSGQNILAVVYQNEDPKLVEDVLDLLSAAYLNYSLEERQKDVRQGIDFVDEQLPQLQARVEAQQEELQKFRQTHNLIDPELQAQQYSTQAGALSQQLVENQTRLSEVRLLYAELRSELAGRPPEIATSTALEENRRYQKLLDLLLDIDSKLAQDSAVFLGESPEIEVLQTQRQNLVPLLEREATRVIRRVESQMQELDNRSQALTRSIENLNQRIKQLSVITREYNDIQRELGIATDNLGQFLAKREGLRIDAAQREVPWQLLTPPGAPQASTASVTRNLVTGIIFGLLLGIGLALLIDRLSNVIHTSNEVKNITKLPVLGVIPLNPYLEEMRATEMIAYLRSARLEMELQFVDIDLSQFQSAMKFLEPFRSLNTNLRLLSPDTPIRSLVISSATANNGKTTTAIYLAQAAAAMGQRVLLIDADLRRPSLHEELDLKFSQGLTDVIAANLDFESVIQLMPGESNLFILPVGTQPPDPTRILASKAMQQFVVDSQRIFDLVIFDAPPLLGLADVNLLSPLTDGILLVVRLHHLKRSLLEQTLEGLQMASIPLLGVVVNGSDEASINAYDDYYYLPQTRPLTPFETLKDKITSPNKLAKEWVAKLTARKP